MIEEERDNNIVVFCILHTTCRTLYVSIYYNIIHTARVSQHAPDRLLLVASPLLSFHDQLASVHKILRRTQHGEINRPFRSQERHRACSYDFLSSNAYKAYNRSDIPCHSSKYHFFIISVLKGDAKIEPPRTSLYLVVGVYYPTIIVCTGNKFGG